MDMWIDAIKAAFAQIFCMEVGGKHFYTLLAVAGGSMLFFGKLIAAHVTGSKKGFIPVFIGMLIALATTVASLAAYDIYVVDHISSSQVQLIVKIVIGVAVFLAVGVSLGKLLLDISWGMTLAAMVLTFAVVFGCVYLGEKGLDAVSGGFKTVDQNRVEPAE